MQCDKSVFRGISPKSGDRYAMGLTIRSALVSSISSNVIDERTRRDLALPSKDEIATPSQRFANFAKSHLMALSCME